MSEREVLPHGDEEYITDTARRIVTNELLIADMTNHAWQISLALMMPRIAEYENVGLILVPKAPHVGLHWINNTAPGCVLSCQMVAEEDIPALQAELDRMNVVLYPQHPQGEAAMDDIKVNGISADPGVVVDGDVHQDYSEDRLADIAIAYGLALDETNDPRSWRTKIRESEEQGDGMAEHHSEQLEASSVKLIELLNANTVGGYFEWDSGSVFLRSGEQDVDDDAYYDNE